MLDEHKIQAALKAEASEIDLPPDLLERINRQCDRLVAPRPSLWVRLVPRLELVAACILVASLIGAAALRHRQQTQNSVGGSPAMETKEPVPASPSAQVFTGDATDGTLRVELNLNRQANGSWSVLATFQSLTTSDLEVHGGCRLVSIQGLNDVVRSCPPVYSVVPAGGTAQTTFVLPASSGDLPQAGSADYLIRSEGPTDPSRALTIPLRAGPGNTREASSVVDLLRAAGLQAALTEELPTQLFGAKQAQHLIVEGIDIVVYSFDGTVSADHGWQTMTNPEANTVSFAFEPEFVQMGSLIVQIDFRNRFMAERIKSALLGRMDHELALQRPLPSVESVKTAHLPGGPKLPDWRLTEDGIRKVISMLKGAEVVTENEIPPQPSSGPNQSVILFLELTSGDTVVIRRAADCSFSTGPVGSPQLMHCTDSKEQILFFERGRMRRLRAPELAQWLGGQWQQDARQ